MNPLCLYSVTQSLILLILRGFPVFPPLFIQDLRRVEALPDVLAFKPNEHPIMEYTSIRKI